MRGVLAVLKLTLKAWMRSKSGLFFSIVFPIMLLLVFGSVFGGQSQVTYKLYVQNNDLDENGNPTELSKIFLEILNRTEVFEIVTVPPGVDAVEYVLVETRAFLERPRLLIIPEGFSEKLVNNTIKAQMGVMVAMVDNVLRFGGDIPSEAREQMLMGRERVEAFLEQLKTENATLVLMVDPSDRSSEVIKGILGNILSSFNMHAIGASPVVTLESREIAGYRGITAVDYYIPGLIAAFIMTNGILGTAPVVSEYRRKGVIKRLAATPLTRAEWVLGNIATQSIMGFILTALMIAVGYIVFNVTAIPSAMGIVLIILGAIAFSGLGMLIAGALRDVEAVTGLANAVAFPMMFLSGAFWPIEIMPSFMQEIARYLPLTYLAEGLRADLILKDPTITINSMVVIAILTMIFIVAGSLMTRWREE